MKKTKKIAVIGLGYVGLPLAAEFAKQYSVIGFDINNTRIEELKKGNDKTLELSQEQVEEALKNKMLFTCKLEDIKDCNIYIITVPTPIDKNNRPDLTPLIKASESVGKVLKKDDIVIYESTVYPGATEEDCVPVLEKFSNLKFNKDFFCGYSPERINPGDKEYTVSKILKITSGSTPKVAKEVDELYKSIIKAGTHLAPNIKVAEAAKVIENSQRDINIAFVNELAMIFNKMNIDTKAVLDAAGTKWNFLKFKPGLVGGHCIGVDPYYLTHKAEEIGYHPEVILSGRRINDNMGIYVANQVIKLMIKNDKKIVNSKVLVLGITFKENCTDVRNSRVVDVICELEEFGCKVDIVDPWADEKDVKHEYNLSLTPLNSLHVNNYDVIILAVSHREFLNFDLGNNALIYDIKAFLPRYDGRL
ncbi:MAG: nucleotide sugar dehydrogenase [Campylobacteraceae bacterium]